MLLLASTSPQRHSLLQQAGIPFTVVESQCNESTITLPHPQACAVERAIAKASAVPRDQIPETGAAVILAADTIVSCDGDLLGKPRDRAHAAAILGRLQGTTHVVSTAHCLLQPDRQGTVSASQAIGVAVAKVTMAAMSDEDIAAYLDSGEWRDRAGAYAIQESGDRFVTDLEGEFDTVVGLNLTTVRRLFYELTGERLPSQEIDR